VLRDVYERLIARIAKRVGFLAMQQTIGFEHIADVARRASHRVHQPAFGIDADVG
jgi:hypothetical protein